MDPFAAFESDSPQQEDPAAEFLAREQAELDKIENNSEDDFLGLGESPAGLNQVNEFKGDFTDEFKIESEEPEVSNDPYSAVFKADVQQQEPEKIKRWREEQKLRITTKDAEEERIKKEWKEKAEKELEEWFKQRKEQLVKTHENNKIVNKKTEAEMQAPLGQEQGQNWDSVSKLVDFNPKGNKNNKDVSRMRSILLQLKQTPLKR